MSWSFEEMVARVVGAVTEEELNHVVYRIVAHPPAGWARRDVLPLIPAGRLAELRRHWSAAHPTDLPGLVSVCRIRLRRSAPPGGCGGRDAPA